MLRDWSYEIETDPVPDETQLPQPEITDEAEKNTELDEITDDVVRNI